MIDWIGYGWIAGEVTGPSTWFGDLTLEVPRGDVLAAAAVTEASVRVEEPEPGSVAVYVREYAQYDSARQEDEDRWDEAVGLPLDVVADAAPQEHPAVNAAERGGQPWTILASMSTRGTARSTSSPRTVRSSSGASVSERIAEFPLSSEGRSLPGEP